jgi:superfamily II DNA/RNA helicase
MDENRLPMPSLRLFQDFKIADNIFDNYTQKVQTFLKAHIKEGTHLSIASAYFTIYAYDRLRNYLEQIESCDFLFGEPSFLKQIDPNRSEGRAFSILDDQISLSNVLQQKEIARACANWIKNKVNIRSVTQKNLMHGKLYHIENGDNHQAIVGSSNFTARGLGLTDFANLELNLKMSDERDKRDLQRWFDSLWNNEDITTDVKEVVLNYLSQIYAEQSPEFIYYKTLYHLRENVLSKTRDDEFFAPNTRFTNTEIWKTLYQFQKDGVKAAINKINQYNGVIIADSVGLGKTYEALAVIKYFELRNDRVLVLAPKKLSQNWSVYQVANASRNNPFYEDKFMYSLLNHTDLSRESGNSGPIDLSTFHWENFDLVVIDESHNFRNNTSGKRDEFGNIIQKSRYQRLFEDIIQKGRKTKVMLLSATPVNNSLSDLKNQINLITAGQKDRYKEELNISDLEQELKNAQKKFTLWAKARRRSNESKEKFLSELPQSLFTILNALSIARNRKHIVRYYAGEMENIGHFPARKKPRNYYPDIDIQNEFPSYAKLSKEIDGYTLALFRPSKYIRAEFKEAYEKKYQSAGFTAFKQETREQYLAGMMKVNFLKRLESSIHSFAITIERTFNKIDALLNKLEAYEKKIENGELEPDLYAIFDAEDDEMDEDILVGGKLKYDLAHFDLESWGRDLQADRDQLLTILSIARQINPGRDQKLSILREIILEKQNNASNIQNPSNNKVLIFTAFADTAHYLYEKLNDTMPELTIAWVAGGNKNGSSVGVTRFEDILTLFSPVSRRKDSQTHLNQKADIDILIGTDCISEGQNLQDCDMVINYDIHWNPVRLIQRFGRIDRIGSKNPSIAMVNFWPTEKLNEYINLKSRVEARMALVNLSASGSDDILNEEDAATEINYRDEQLKKLQEEILDLEDFDESANLSDFTLDDFWADLDAYLKLNEEKLKSAPFGLNAITPIDRSLYRGDQQISIEDEVRIRGLSPGIIFTFKQKAEAPALKAINPLAPYFLAYIGSEGEVLATYKTPKQILEIFRELSRGLSQPIETLTEAFRKETEDGKSMDAYNKQLKAALTTIRKRLDRDNLTGLQLNRGSSLIPPKKIPINENDFELVTWLIIK